MRQEKKTPEKPAVGKKSQLGQYMVDHIPEIILQNDPINNKNCLVV